MWGKIGSAGRILIFLSGCWLHDGIQCVEIHFAIYTLTKCALFCTDTIIFMKILKNRWDM